jgi:heat shock protein HslJ
MLASGMSAGKWMRELALCATLCFCACEAQSNSDTKASLPVEEPRSTEANAAPTKPGDVANPGMVEGETRAFGGEMRYMADAAIFTECTSGRSHPMAMEADYISAERAYLDAVEKPGGPLYVTFEGIVAPRPAVDREGTEDEVIVKRFIHAWPGERCERAKADASLVHTRWRIVQLGKTAVRTHKDSKEPHILLVEQDGAIRYRATVGCNQIVGAAELEGSDITFKPGPTTLMACPPPLDTYERALVKMLGQAKHWRVLANTLELFDELGTSIALFRAVYL